MNSKVSKSLVASLFVAAAFFLSAAVNTVSAKEKAKVVSATPAQEISVKYVGETAEYVYVKISFTQTADQNANIAIYDLQGEKLFEENVTSKEYSRIIKVSPEEIKSLRVNYTGDNGESNKTFKINSNATTSYALTDVAG